MKYPENHALLAGIIAHAEDDAPRLVYADWLDEHGDPDRAAFIRVQCALFDKSPADADYVDLKERLTDLGAALWQRRSGPELPEALEFYENLNEERDDCSAGYHRGFPYFAQSAYDDLSDDRATALRDALPEVIRTTTIRGLNLYGGDFGPYLPDILGIPAAAQLSGLVVDNTGYAVESDVDLNAVISSQTAPNLKWLDLGQLSTPADAAALTRRGQLSRLRRMDVYSLGCGPAQVKRLLAADWFPRLRRFATQPEHENALALVKGLAALPELHTVELRGLPESGAETFAKARGFAALGRLFLNSGNLRGDATAALARARLPKLTALEMVGCQLRNEEIKLLAQSELFANLRVLSLTNNQITDRSLAALADSPCAPGLRVLRLGENSFSAKGLEVFARPGAFPNLTTLDLCATLKRKASVADLTRFLSCPNLPRLRHLNLQGWPVDDNGAKALAANPAFAGLTSLYLGYCRIKSKGAAALFASPHLRRLLKLELLFNKIGKAAEALCDPAVLPNLCYCYLTDAIPAKLKQRLNERRQDIFWRDRGEYHSP